MINNKKVCICIPVGRKRYLEILVKYLLKQKDVVDEIRLWVNTRNVQDLEYIHSLKNLDPIFTYDYSSRGDEWEGDSRAISLFFKNYFLRNKSVINFIIFLFIHFNYL